MKIKIPELIIKSQFFVIPFSNGKLEDSLSQTFPDKSGFIIGNPYLGAEFSIPQSPVKVELGFRIPVTPDDKPQASLVGIYSDIDRSEAFIRDIVPVYAAVNYYSVSESNILLKARAGVDLWFNTKEYGYDQNTILAGNYTLQTGYFQKYVNFVFGLSGRYEIDQGSLVKEKQNYMQYGLLVIFKTRRFRPALSLKVPGKDLGEYLNYVLGLNCTYTFD